MCLLGPVPGAAEGHITSNKVNLDKPGPGLDMKDSESILGAHCFKLSFYSELKVIKKEFTIKSRAVLPEEQPLRLL